MKQYLENLKEQSPEKKQRIIKVCAFLATALIVLVYVGLRILFPKPLSENTPTQGLLDGAQNIFETGIDQFDSLSYENQGVVSDDSEGSLEETTALDVTNPLLEGVFDNSVNQQQEIDIPQLSDTTVNRESDPLYDESNPYPAINQPTNL